MVVRGNLHDTLTDTRVIEVAYFKSEVKLCHCCTLVYRAIALLLVSGSKFIFLRNLRAYGL